MKHTFKYLSLTATSLNNRTKECIEIFIKQSGDIITCEYINKTHMYRIQQKYF